jgi:copper chaperone CopZ
MFFLSTFTSNLEDRTIICHDGSPRVKRVIDTLRLTVGNSVCSGWEHAVKRALRQIDGVQGVTASYKANLIGISFDTARITAAALKQHIESLGYDVVMCG